MRGRGLRPPHGPPALAGFGPVCRGAAARDQRWGSLRLAYRWSYAPVDLLGGFGIYAKLLATVLFVWGALRGRRPWVRVGSAVLVGRFVTAPPTWRFETALPQVPPSLPDWPEAFAARSRPSRDEPALGRPGRAGKARSDLRIVNEEQRSEPFIQDGL